MCDDFLHLLRNLRTKLLLIRICRSVPYRFVIGGALDNIQNCGFRRSFLFLYRLLLPICTSLRRILLCFLMLFPRTSRRLAGCRFIEILDNMYHRIDSTILRRIKFILFPQVAALLAELRFLSPFNPRLHGSIVFLLGQLMKRILAVGTTFLQRLVHFIHRNRDNRRILLLATLTPNGHDAILNRSSHGIVVFRVIRESAVCICKILGAFLLLMWYNMSRRTA